MPQKTLPDLSDEEWKYPYVFRSPQFRDIVES